MNEILKVRLEFGSTQRSPETILQEIKSKNTASSGVASCPAPVKAPHGKAPHNILAVWGFEKV